MGGGVANPLPTKPTHLSVCPSIDSYVTVLTLLVFQILGILCYLQTDIAQSFDKKKRSYLGKKDLKMAKKNFYVFLKILSLVFPGNSQEQKIILVLVF